MKPLRRKPKTLDTAPVLHGGKGGSGSSAGGPSTKKADGPTGSAPGVTEERGALTGIADPAPRDAEVLRRATEISQRLSVVRPRRQARARRGPGDLVSMRWRAASDDIDLDRTLEQLIEHPHPQDDQIIVREQLRTRRAVVLLVDVSGSMRGERVRTAAATVGALAGELVRDDLAVVAFWSDAMLLSSLGAPIDSGRLLESMLELPARGLTNVAFPLEIAARELAGSPLRDSRVVLLSDCVHNAGVDPRPLAAQLPRLDVLCDTSGEHDLDLARDLAQMGRGRLRLARNHRDVAPALSSFFQR